LSSKVSQLKNHKDRVTGLNFIEKLQSNDEAESEIRMIDTSDNFTEDMLVPESGKSPHEKINIEINIFQRTSVFSSDISMWI
jgi:hypothetical protein